MLNKENAKQQVKGLVKEFLQLYKDHLSQHKFDDQKEANTEKYIEDLFERLGWSRYDLERQHTIKEGRVDYSVNLEGHPYLFVEVKKHGTKDLDLYKKQAIDYAWQAQIKWVILTNLREIRIYNAQYKGQPEEIIRVVQPIYIDKLIERFDHLWWLSKESARENLIEKGAVEISKVKLKEPISVLSESLLRWRSLLTKEMKAHPRLNEISGLDKEAAKEWVDEAVQMLLNRFIFLRTIESLGQWAFSLREVQNKWRENKKKPLMEYISEFFRDADTKYNAGLFAKHKCEELHLRDEILEQVIEEMYVDKAHDVEWDFRALASDRDILGLAYEQYLGATLTEKTAQVKKSKAKRKKMGIYYTPKYIVNYIVGNTLGELLKKTDDSDITKIRVLDPACGSGSFLKQAYRQLSKEIAKRGLDKQHFLHAGPTDESLFSIYDIALKNCIKGVDLDKKAVEMAKLNMLLVGAEKGVHRLPDLDLSIRQGNSLIDDRSVSRRSFKWEQEFKQIMDDGRFDVVVGNPPYGAELSKLERDFIAKKFKFSSSYKNTALVFIERSLDLIKKDGYFGMIVPKSLTFSQVWKSGRELIKERLIKVVDVSKAFRDVLLEQVIIILKRDSKDKSYILEDLGVNNSMKINKKYIDLTDSIILHGDKEDFDIFEKMNLNSIYLSEITKTCRGLPLQKYLGDETTKYPVIKGKTISRYKFELSGKYLPENIVKQNIRKARILQQPKIISQRIVAHVTRPKDHIIIMSALDREGILDVDTVENTIVTNKNYSLEFLLCLLNSKLISWYAYRYIFSKAIRTMDFDSYYLGKIPIPKKKIDNVPFEKIISKMLTLNKRLNEIGDKKTDERAEIEEEIKKTDAEIDKLVYKLYDITEPEEKIIKESLK